MKNDPSLTDNNEKFSIAENKEYYTKTTNRIKELEAMIESLEKEGNSKTDKEKQDGINEITNLIKTERENFYNTIDFLPNYDKTLYAKMYDDTLDKVTKLKNKFFPKKKFAFSSKVAKTTNKVQEQATSSKVLFTTPSCFLMIRFTYCPVVPMVSASRACVVSFSIHFTFTSTSILFLTIYLPLPFVRLVSSNTNKIIYYITHPQKLQYMCMTCR